MNSCVHPFVHDGGGHRRGSDVAARKKRELDHAGPVLGEVCAAAGIAHHANLLEVAAQMAYSPGLVSLHELQGLVEPLQHVGRRDVGTRVVHYHREPAHLVDAKPAAQPLTNPVSQRVHIYIVAGLPPRLGGKTIPRE